MILSCLGCFEVTLLAQFLQGQIYRTIYTNKMSNTNLLSILSENKFQELRHLSE